MYFESSIQILKIQILAYKLESQYNAYRTTLYGTVYGDPYGDLKTNQATLSGRSLLCSAHRVRGSGRNRARRPIFRRPFLESIPQTFHIPFQILHLEKDFWGEHIEVYI